MSQEKTIVFTVCRTSYILDIFWYLVIFIVIFSGSTKWKRYQGAFMEEIEKIPPHNTGTLTMEYYSVIKTYIYRVRTIPTHNTGPVTNAYYRIIKQLICQTSLFSIQLMEYQWELI